jgi:hypothetical protein
MGLQLKNRYEEVGRELGSLARMKLAMLTKISSAQASELPDSAANMKLIDNCATPQAEVMCLIPSRARPVRTLNRVRYPHPYFGGKFLVFFNLRPGNRCKILKLKKLFAK